MHHWRIPRCKDRPKHQSTLGHIPCHLELIKAKVIALLTSPLEQIPPKTPVREMHMPSRAQSKTKRVLYLLSSSYAVMPDRLASVHITTSWVYISHFSDTSLNDLFPNNFPARHLPFLISSPLSFFYIRFVLLNLEGNAFIWFEEEWQRNHTNRT